MTRVAYILLLLSVLAGCTAIASPPGTTEPSLAPLASSPGAPSGAAPLTPGASASSDGRIIHVNLLVPLTRSTSVGSICGTADLRSTGPIAASIPGASFKFLQVLSDLPGVPAETPQSAPTPPGSGGPAPATPSDPGTAAPLPTAGRTVATIGEQQVPQTGVVATPIGTDANFPASCKFSFDVAMTATVDRYLFGVGATYFPIPIIARSQLEATGWIANIGVNPQ
jgi:hypothetical protein